MDPDTEQTTEPKAAVPPIAHFIPGLSAEQLQSGAWDDDFLLLGAALRAIYGTQVFLDETYPAYFVQYARDLRVRVTCAAGNDGTTLVGLDCAVAVDGPQEAVAFRALCDRPGGESVLVSLQADGLLVRAELSLATASGARLDAAGVRVRRVADELRVQLRMANRSAA